MRAVGLGLIFVCCSLLGIWADGDEKKRLQELEQFAYLFELLKGEIDYKLTPLMEACRNVAVFGKKGPRQVFLSFAEVLEKKESVSLLTMWQEALHKSEQLLHLKKEDYLLLESFGSCCGYLDKNMQKRNLDMVLEKLEHERKQLECRYEKCSKLNRTLGVLIGSALVIFLL